MGHFIAARSRGLDVGAPTFIPFVLACLDRVIAHAPDARASVGAGLANYFGQLAFALSMLALLVYVLVALPTPLGWLVVVKLLLVAAMLPVAAVWAVRSRPRTVPLAMGAFLPGLPKLAGNW
eukprot:gene28983-29377_t